MKLAGTRLAHTMKYRGLTKDSNAGPVWTGEVRLWEKALTDPLHWRQPRKIFVNSEGDLFHESIPDEWIDRVLAIAALCPHHTFQVLTKRAERMRDYFAAVEHDPRGKALHAPELRSVSNEQWYAAIERGWPLDNLWLGVSCERQQEADERIPLLLQTPAAVRFISAEPLLGPIDLTKIRLIDKRGCGPDVTFSALRGWYGGEGGDVPARLDWVITGGESGPRARITPPGAFENIRYQCRAADVAYFHKQNGEWIIRENADKNSPFHAADFVRVGKRAAGRLLDGVEHNGFPEERS